MLMHALQVQIVGRSFVQSVTDKGLEILRFIKALHNVKQNFVWNSQYPGVYLDVT